MIFAVIGIAVVTRLIPHYPNFTAIGAVALFGGACFSRRTAILIPVIALFVSDLFLNNLIYASVMPGGYDGFILLKPGSLWSYGAFIIIALLASRLIKSSRVLPIIGTSILGSSVFFLISNFAVWMTSVVYPKTVAGLLAAFGAGIPFFGNTVAGDLFFVGVLFGGLELVKAFAPKLIYQRS